MSRFTSDLKYSDVTPERDFLNRRQLMGSAAGLGIAALAGAGSVQAKAMTGVKSPFSTDEEPNSFKDITTYNNFYEFGTGKDDPSRYADALTTDPWSVEIGGMVNAPGSYSMEDILKGVTLEERIYRFRCVEAWAMVIPWIGFPLSDLLAKADPASGAKYVAFETLYRPEEMHGQSRKSFPWPYVEGLRLDEAMNPLTIIATGLYGKRKTLSPIQSVL